MGVTIREDRGAWWVFVHHHGKRTKKRIGPGKEGQRAAKAVAENLQARLALGDTGFLEPAPLTFAEYAESWLSGYVAANLKVGSQEKYASVLRKHWFPMIGHLPLSDISRNHVRSVINQKLREGTKLATARLVLDVLKSCLNTAVEDELIAKNPAARAGKMLFTDKRSKKIEALNRGVLAFLLQTASEKFPQAYPIVLLLARTGMRIGEALALQVDDIDFGRREITVKRTWGSRSKVYGEARINTPKSGKPRSVDMSKQLAQVLKAYLKTRNTDSEQNEEAGSLASQWLFPARNNMPLNPDTFRSQLWKPLLEASALTYVKPHVLRHTFATLLIQNGESLAYIRDQLGHSSIKITVDTYGHLVPGANKKAVDKLDESVREALASKRTLYAPFEFNPNQEDSTSD
jgi:integrase